MRRHRHNTQSCRKILKLIFLYDYARFVVQQKFCWHFIPCADDESIFVCTEIRHRGRERRLKILPRRNSASAAVNKKCISGSVGRIEPASEVIGAYEMRQLQRGRWAMQSEIDKPSVNVSINFKVNRPVVGQHRREKKKI